MYVLERELVVQTSMEKAWAFISRPENLNKITPEDMHFRIITDVPAEMENGLLIEYSVKIPWIGRQKWLTELKHINEGVSFVDEQRYGPYKLWYHYHKIEPVEGGVLFTDKVTYVPPFSILGKMANVLFIRPMLERIFDYRQQRFHELLTEDLRVYIGDT